MQNIVRFLIVVMLFVSCKRAADPPQVPVEPIARYVSKIANAENEYTQYEYNGQYQLSRYISQWVGGSGNIRAVTDYSYSNARIAKSQSQSGRVEYITQNGKVKSTMHFTRNDMLRSVIFYTYNHNQQLIEWIEQMHNRESYEPAEIKHSYEYYPDGNIKRIERFFRFNVTDSFTSMGGSLYDGYDRHRNPDMMFGTPVYLPGIVVAINNPGRIQNFDDDGRVHQINLLQYTYYADGMVATKKSSLSNSSISILFNYSY